MKKKIKTSVIAIVILVTPFSFVFLGLWGLWKLYKHKYSKAD